MLVFCVNNYGNGGKYTVNKHLIAQAVNYIHQPLVVDNIVCVLQLQKLPLVDHSFKKATNPVLTLNWATDAAHPQVVAQPISIFSVVTCVLKSDAQPLKWTVRSQVISPTDWLTVIHHVNGLEHSLEPECSKQHDNIF